MMNTLPLRRTGLHFVQRRLTDERVFIVRVCRKVADGICAKIVGREKREVSVREVMVLNVRIDGVLERAVKGRRERLVRSDSRGSMLSGRRG